MTDPGNPSENEQQALCEGVLHTLVEALRHPDPEFNAQFSFPQRMQVKGAAAGQARHDEAGACSVPVEVYIGEATRAYVLDVRLEGHRVIVTLRDDADLEEQFALAQPQGPPRQEDVQALYDALATDVASRFGTDS